MASKIFPFNWTPSKPPQPPSDTATRPAITYMTVLEALLMALPLRFMPFLRAVALAE
jgi:hypothetical protein